MPFRYRINLPKHSPPIRAYIHDSGLEKTFENHIPQKPAFRAEAFLFKTLEAYSEHLKQFDYILAALWKDNELRTMDFFGFGNMNGKWPGNPDVYSWVVREGKIIVPEKALTIPTTTSVALTCGETIMILGDEEKHRRTKKSLDEYMSNPPNNPEMVTSTY